MVHEFTGRARYAVAVALSGIAALIFSVTESHAQQPAESIAFTKAQRVLFSNCSGCHIGGGHAGGLKMDSLELIMKGGDRGPLVIPGNAEASLIVRALRYTNPELKMPPRGKVPDADIDAVSQWIDGLAPNASSSAPMPTASPAKVAAVPTGRAMLPPPSFPAPEAKADAKSMDSASDSTVTPEQEKFFETKVRPVLASNCYTCHTQGASGGLRLDSRQAMLTGGRRGPAIVPGNADGSLLVNATHYDSALKMPPAGKLKADDVAALEQWISDGAPWPEVKIAKPVLPAKAREFWSFQPPVKRAAPSLTSPESKAWVRNDVDRFIFAKLQEKGLKPVGDASKRVLIRRVTYDLTGLPPTAAEVDSFLADKSPKAYETLVERLLASQAYGERWGRKWLDLVRYADTSGDDGDFPIPQAIKYRDYVIKAFQQDKPYNQFIREQIAGDLLTANSEDEHWQQIIATGYLAGAPRYEDRDGHMADIVDNVGYTYLGMSVACARCHDHKFDPIPTANYYSLYGIVASTKIPSPGSLATEYQTGFTYRDPKAMEKPEWKVFESQLAPVANALAAVLRLPGTYDDLVPQLQQRRKNLFEHAPDLGESAFAVTEGTPTDQKIQIYGDSKNLGALAKRGFPQVLGGEELPEGTKGSGRLQLADWIANPANPLTARVMVNRIWQGHFGRGLVATPNDFGMRGTAPSNQELLDFLAVKFAEEGWSIKGMHREILYSHAYQLSSENKQANTSIDPDNTYIWRHSRHRLEAEEIRDSLLAVSGLLDPTAGSQHPFPPMHTWNYEQQNMFEADPVKFETDKRTVYQMVQRTVRPPFFILFDGPSVNASTEQRTNSLTPLQALYFMNGDFPKRAAGALSTKLLGQEAGPKEAAQKAFQMVYGRPPSAEEIERTTAFLARASDAFSTQGAGSTEARKLAFEQFAKALFASNEFMFVD